MKIPVDFQQRLSRFQNTNLLYHTDKYIFTIHILIQLILISPFVRHATRTHLKNWTYSISLLQHSNTLSNSWYILYLYSLWLFHCKQSFNRSFHEFSPMSPLMRNKPWQYCKKWDNINSNIKHRHLTHASRLLAYLHRTDGDGFLCFDIHASS